MKKRLNFWFFSLAIMIAIVVISSSFKNDEEQDIPMYPGTSLPAVKIGNLWWAPVNAGYDKDHIFGLLYQWGRKYGQGYNTTETPGLTLVAGMITIDAGNDIANKDKFFKREVSPHDWCNPQVMEWNMSNHNPCPAGWRVTSTSELIELYSYGSTWVKSGGPDYLPGRWFAGNHDGDHTGSIFLPAAGNREPSDGSLNHVRWTGNYWSGSQSEKYAFFLNFDNRRVYAAGYNGRAFGFTVRCVRN
ncbi:MAG: hypothetical protein ACD_77C00335G0002 [uncultured bacterium]|nr:MAG: hypothetical protein ACD_77C00335G0002 [uncultured bacterium]